MEAAIRALDNDSPVLLVSEDSIAREVLRQTLMVHLIEGEAEVHWKLGHGHVARMDADGVSLSSGGDAALRGQAITLPMAAGDVLVANKGDQFELRATSTCQPKPLLFLFEISDSLLYQAVDANTIIFRCCSSHRGSSDEFEGLIEAIRSVLDAMALDDQRGSFLLFSNIYALLNELVLRFADRFEAVNPGEHRAWQILRYMGAHYRERLTLNLVANRFYLDPAYLSRLIRRETGINFKAHLTQMRIECAKRFLTQSSMSIARVATECGYTNLSSFNTACNRLLGMTPSEYRAKTSITAIAKDVSAGEESHRYQQLRQREKIRDQMRETRRIDMARTGDPLKPIWTELLNIGSVRELLHGHIKRQIAFIQGQIAFKYGRMWGLFGPEALCDLEKGEYANFGTLDEALDAVIEVGLIPWIVIGKCSDPERLYECENKAWQHALSSFLSHVLDRYGKQLIARWRIEMVFEGDPSSPQFDIYRDRLAFTRKRIKDIDQAMLIGGAGFQQLSDEGKLSERIKSIADLLDFVSLKVFPYSGSSEVGEQRHPMRIVETGVFIESVQRVRAAMMHAGVSVPIYVTEWSNTISTEDLINDTLFKGCFIIKTCIEAIDSVAGMGYWLASDWYSAEQRSGSLLTGGPGLITKDRIPKPALSAFGFLAELTERKLIFKSEDCLICQREGDSSILGFNYVQPEKTYYLKDESSFQPGEVLSLFKEEKKRCSFLLTHLRNGAYEIRTYSCDARYGSIFNQWATLGFAKHLRRSDIEYLKNNSNMHMELEERMITDGVCRIDRLAGANEFFLINLRYCAKTNK